MKSIKIQYFAILREQAKLDSEEIITDVATPRELYRHLQKKHHFSLGENIMKCAINDNFRDLDNPIADGDKVVFIPPVSGG